MTVTANVRMPDGQTAKKTLVLTLQRVVLKDPTGGKDIEGRWMITGIKDAAAPKGWLTLDAAGGGAETARPHAAAAAGR